MPSYSRVDLRFESNRLSHHKSKIHGFPLTYEEYKDLLEEPVGLKSLIRDNIHDQISKPYSSSLGIIGYRSNHLSLGVAYSITSI